ncbi:uncharacterized protein C7orf50 homolog [Cylas formicarius]|uniref:uncharacterized protein C7orf50 homolog n=1 Tax=Cylas formicarius TaxID=197179 RepID=UPI002958C89A|nr:uncharacterized protein C7orf50 homolog [Cylas formicarius]
MIEKSKIKTRARKSKVIAFDDEVVTKDSAKKILQQQFKYGEFKTENINMQLPVSSGNTSLSKTNRTKHKLDNLDVDQKAKHIKISNKKIQDREQVTENMETEGNDIKLDSKAVQKPKKESIRSKKREKHAQLIQEKKIKVQLDFQQKALNYLSNWKYCRSQWKFEKLRQIYLQQNLFDSDKIPQKFWEIVLEYFSGAKGQSRQLVLDAALKIVEQEQNSGETVQEEKIKRAQDILQYLQ